MVILYPQGKISPLQEKLFCTLGGNIETIAIDGDFDACRALVKQAFDDEELKKAIGLNSANSIISPSATDLLLLRGAAQLPQEKRKLVVWCQAVTLAIHGCWRNRSVCRSSALSPRPTPTIPCRASLPTVSGSRTRPWQRCRTRWMSASLTTGRVEELFRRKTGA